MSDDTRKVRRKLATLTNSLDDLETRLAPLLSQSLPELILSLDTIQQAKLQVVIPYLVYDLVFVYLKTRGLDPKTHPVIAELDRVRQYFNKIKDAEDPAKRQLAIDKVAATRFIKHAISQAKDTTPSNVPGPAVAAAHIRLSDNNNDTGGGSTASRDVRLPVKMTEKMLEREKYHEALREEDLASDDGDDGALEVIDDEEDGPSSNEPEARRMPSGEDASPPLRESGFDAASSKEKGKGKGKAKAVVDGTSVPLPGDPPPSETAVGKRRRPPMDPFAGYGDSPDTRSSAAPADASAATSTSRSGGDDREKRSRKRSKKLAAS